MIEWWQAGLVFVFLLPVWVVAVGYMYGVFEERFGQEPAEENVTNE